MLKVDADKINAATQAVQECLHSLRDVRGCLVKGPELDDNHVSTAICGLLSIMTRSYVSEANVQFLGVDAPRKYTDNNSDVVFEPGCHISDAARMLVGMARHYGFAAGVFNGTRLHADRLSTPEEITRAWVERTGFGRDQ